MAAIQLFYTGANADVLDAAADALYQQADQFAAECPATVDSWNQQGDDNVGESVWIFFLTVDGPDDLLDGWADAATVWVEAAGATVLDAHRIDEAELRGVRL